MAATVQLITPELLQRVLDQARQSARRRMNYNFHPTLSDNPHRFLNVMLRGTYIAPHRHLDPPKSESFLVLEGRVAFFIFHDDGTIAGRHLLGAGAGLGIDISPGVWHTLAVLTDHAICYEVKPGPYFPASDKSFAPWAPRESDPQAAAYLQSLLDAPM
jgi:cupin fold WbuC family metalloprotein